MKSMGLITILLADDHEVVRAGYRRLLESTSNIEVITEVASGEDAYCRYCDYQPDVLVMDLTMPGINGHETLREIRAREDQLTPGSRATVFMITASSSPDDMMEALLSGSCDDFLTKPVMNRTLMELLQKHGLV